MTDFTDESVKALLDGATPGRRVQFHGSYCPEAVGTPFTDWDTSHDMSVIRPDGSRYRLAHYKHASDAYLSQMAPDLARALLDARAELARVKADAAVAVALVVSELRQFVTDSYQCGCMDAGCAGRHAERNSTLEALSETLDALAPADGLAMVQELRAELTEWRENYHVVSQSRAAVRADRDAYRLQIEGLIADNDRVRNLNYSLTQSCDRLRIAVAKAEARKNEWIDFCDELSADVGVETTRADAARSVGKKYANIFHAMRAELAQARAEAQAAVARGMELAAEILAVRADVLLVDAGADAELVRVLDASVAAIRTAATSLRTGEAG